MTIQDLLVREGRWPDTFGPQMSQLFGRKITVNYPEDGETFQECLDKYAGLNLIGRDCCLHVWVNADSSESTTLGGWSTDYNHYVTIEVPPEGDKE